ncbi:hypothetical protein QE432_004877 [Agrobacterium sp. SORGH_AS 745]|nr:hypothetical protein [Agrobacterium tumefaciens]MDQ1223249.1 hypothetical protein [Agrobacterium sp. SORGH_AS_0745]
MTTVDPDLADREIEAAEYVLIERSLVLLRSGKSR